MSSRFLQDLRGPSPRLNQDAQRNGQTGSSSLEIVRTHFSITSISVQTPQAPCCSVLTRVKIFAVSLAGQLNQRDVSWKGHGPAKSLEQSTLTLQKLVQP